MASVRDWKDSVLAQTQDPDHIQTAEALAELLDGTSSPADIAERITSVYEPPPEMREEWFHEGQSQKVIEFWGIHMSDAIRAFGDSVIQDRLIALLVDMSKQPDVKNPDGSSKGGPGSTYWRDLPDWESQFFHYSLIYREADMYAPEGEDRDDYLRQGLVLLNKTKFAATMLERGLFTSGLPPKASEFLQIGLEQPYDDSNTVDMKPFEWQVLLPLAATWLIRAGQTIYRHCLNDEVPGPEASDEVQASWGGGTWTKKRWAFWKEQLEKFSHRHDMSEECRVYAAQALTKMKEVETQGLSAREWRNQYSAAVDDADHLQAIDALASLIEGQTSPSDAAKEITSTYETWLKANPGRTTHLYTNKVCYFFLMFFCDAIEVFSESQQRDLLIELLTQISRQPDVRDLDGSLKKHDTGAVYWRDLPTWPFIFGYNALEYNEEYLLDELDEYLAQAPRLLSVSRFGASMLARGKLFPGLPLEASCALKAGLEQEYEKKDEVRQYQWQLLIPATTAWLLFAGEAIYRHCTGASFGGSETCEVGGDEWARGTWSLQRWALWKQNLRTFAARADFTEECREIADRTVNKMEEIEAGYGF